MFFRSLKKSKRPRKSNGKFRKSHDVWLYGFVIGLALLTGTGWAAAFWSPAKAQEIVWQDMTGVKVYTSSDRAPVTMYNSVPEQTDDSPCTSSDGSNICDLFAKGQNICASNDYKIGTMLTVEGLGDCVVKDRMNSRYTNTGAVDWYNGMDVAGARKFGKKFIEVKVFTQN
jgi:3D (Asp-Asp-Asp) domain-containing protein